MRAASQGLRSYKSREVVEEERLRGKSPTKAKGAPIPSLG